jgi:hypothetical protein
MAVHGIEQPEALARGVTRVGAAAPPLVYSRRPWLGIFEQRWQKVPDQVPARLGARASGPGN